jgi:hypothetical protein
MDADTRKLYALMERAVVALERIAGIEAPVDLPKPPPLTEAQLKDASRWSAAAGSRCPNGPAAFRLRGQVCESIRRSVFRSKVLVKSLTIELPALILKERSHSC